MSGPSVVVAATFTAEPVQRFLEHWLGALHLDWPVRFAPFDQVFQTILDPTSRFAANAGGVNVVLLHRDLDGLDRALDSYRSATPLILVSCPGARDPGPELPSTIRVLNGHAIAATYAVNEVFDAHAAREGALPYTDEFFAALATALAREIHLVAAPPHKVIAVDCDNTLWSGICGEDGAQGVIADAPRVALQRFLVRQREAGKLLAIVSKNNEEDIWEVFDTHPDFPLRREHFSAWRVNWNAKSGNLKSLAAELNLGLDSFVFLDDDARECAEVRAGAPAVTVLPLPAAAEIEPLLTHVWAFDQLPATAEDKQRGAFYDAEAARAEAEKSSASFADFIAGLDLSVEFAPISAATLPRAAQLTQRTNQMNCSTIRRTESELAAALETGALRGWIAKVRDRFGDYGIVGLMLATPGAEMWDVDTMLLSCRALGRGVEHRMLAFVAERAEESGARKLHVRFRPTKKNKPAQSFLESLTLASRDDLGFVLDADDAASLRYVPPAERTPATSSAAASETQSGSPPANKPDYAAIARLRSARALMDKLRVRGSAGLDLSSADETEGRLALLWSELLGGVAVGRDADFFALGGHSLLAVQLLSRVRKDFGADLTLDVVYSGPMTVRTMARAIRVAQGEPATAASINSDEAEMAVLLAEIEALTDEEVRAALAAEDELRSR